MVNFKRMCFKRYGTIKLLILLILLLISYVSGLFTHLFEKDLSEFNKEFENSNFELQATATDNQDLNQIDSKFSDVNNLNFKFLYNSKDACKPIKLEDNNLLNYPFLTILVKSKYSNFKHRQSIRKSWGRSDANHLIRTVFLIGYPNSLDQYNIVEKNKIS